MSHWDPQYHEKPVGWAKQRAAHQIFFETALHVSGEHPETMKRMGGAKRNPSETFRKRDAEHAEKQSA